VTHACNPSYRGVRDLENPGLRSAWVHLGLIVDPE
jgi:hypothetical protein